jgi:alanine dehydrogenase
VFVHDEALNPIPYQEGEASCSRGNVLVLGCGVVGTEAAKMAAGLGANVTIMDVNLDR